MCGIAGIWDREIASGLKTCVESMCAALVHRGPDGAGSWTDEEAGIALGHRRLAIIDLTKTGHQPMASSGGRYVITYNGELYNTEELRTQLTQEGVVFRGTSDTEVLVNAIELWGIDFTAKQLNGIFAFAVWDRSTRALSLVRDRVGVKPLFWSLVGRRLLFSSELKGLTAVPGFDCQLDLAAIGSYLQFNYIRSPMTIYRAARSLEAGTILTMRSDGTIRQHCYWDLAGIVAEEKAKRTAPSNPEESIAQLEALLSDSVGRQLVSDVPIGVFLSGGVDSSIVAAMMQRVSDRPIKSFSIGFEAPSFDEAKFAKAVAAAIGTDHTELYVTEREALNCVPELARLYDQPLADISAIPTYLLAKLAREHVTVALTGDGGDELFYGYSRFVKAARSHHLLSRTSSLGRRWASQVLDRVSSSRKYALESSNHASRFLWHASRLLHLASHDVRDTYLHFITNWAEPNLIAPAASSDIAHWEASKRITSNFDEQMMYFDSVSYLQDCVLAKVDRASMSASLEARVPLLDDRIIKLAWSLPQNIKHRDGQTKWCLREVLYRHVPRKLVERPKAGFAAPVGIWLRGPLREWAESHLSEKALCQHDLFDPAPIRRLWQAHVTGAVDGAHLLWSILLLQDWLQNIQQPLHSHHSRPIALACSV